MTKGTNTVVTFFNNTDIQWDPKSLKSFCVLLFHASNVAAVSCKCKTDNSSYLYMTMFKRASWHLKKIKNH